MHSIQSSGKLFALAAFAFAFRLGSSQYNFPVDSCACHIHYEHWVQLQLQLSNTLTADFPAELTKPPGTSAVHTMLAAQECRDPRAVENRLEWTMGPASSDCAAGHMAHYILCAQQYLMTGDVEGAALYYDFANYLLPVAAPCMDPAIWTITPEVFYDRYRAVMEAAPHVDGKAEPDLIRELAWRPLL